MQLKLKTSSSTFVVMCQHFREHLDKLFAKGIGLLGDALTEAFMILSDVSSSKKKKLRLTFNDKSLKY